jgi:predicted ester cyclase
MQAEEQNKAIVRRFYEEVFNQGQESVLDEIIAPNYLDYGHNPPGQGIEGAKADFHGGAAYFSNPHFVIDDLIASGDQVVARWTGTLTHTGEFMGVPASDKSVTLTGISIYRVADGKLLETRNAVNWLDLLQQLGALPG